MFTSKAEGGMPRLAGKEKGVRLQSGEIQGRDRHRKSTGEVNCIGEG